MTAATGFTRRWILRVTVAEAAGFAVAAGVGASLAVTAAPTVSSPATWVVIAFGALLLLASIPVAQWIVLRAGGRRDALAWIPVTMGVWALAILWTAVPSPFIDESSPFALALGLYVLAGVLMAVTVATVTAQLARRLFGAE